MSDFSAKRLLGLDIVRACAILLVMLSHGRFALQSPADYLFLTFGGKFGVELFFVLSGFLIGTILLTLCDKGLSPRAIGNFWMRRWFRTLPAYFAVLLFIWLVFGTVDPFYFLFLQGIVENDFSLLPVSWSLAIEEWFYLTFPLICLATLALMPKRGFLAAAILLLLAPLCMQIQQLAACGTGNELAACFEHSVRKYTFRFTTIAMGALLAYIHVRHNLKQLLAGKVRLLAMVTIFVMAVTLAFTLDILLQFPGHLPPFIGLNLFFPLIGIASTLLVALFYVWEPALPAWMVRIITFISLTSYSNYLWHLMVLDSFRDMLPQWRGVGLFILFFMATLAVAAVSYALTERPFLRWRERITRHISRQKG